MRKLEAVVVVKGPARRAVAAWVGEFALVVWVLPARQLEEEEEANRGNLLRK